LYSGKLTIAAILELAELATIINFLITATIIVIKFSYTIIKLFSILELL
jgi:hypothetical protein